MENDGNLTVTLFVYEIYNSVMVRTGTENGDSRRLKLVRYRDTSVLVRTATKDAANVGIDAGKNAEIRR